MKTLTSKALRDALDEIEGELLQENRAALSAAKNAPAYLRALFSPPNDMNVFYEVRYQLNRRLSLGKWYRQRQPRRRNLREVLDDAD